MSDDTESALHVYRREAERLRESLAAEVARRERAEAALRYVRDRVWVDCKGLDHRKGEYHLAEEDCPVAARLRELLDAALAPATPHAGGDDA